MDFFDVSVGAWQITYMLLALLPAVLISMFVIRIFGKSAKKTFNAIKR